MKFVWGIILPGIKIKAPFIQFETNDTVIPIIWFHLSVYEDDRPQQPPRPSLPVHVEHAQDLEEPDSPDGGGGEHLAVGAHGEDHDGGQNHDEIWSREIITILQKIQGPGQGLAAQKNGLPANWNQ